MVLKTYEKEEK